MLVTQCKPHAQWRGQAARGHCTARQQCQPRLISRAIISYFAGHEIQGFARSSPPLAAATTTKMQPTHVTKRPRANSDPGIIATGRDGMELQSTGASVGPRVRLSVDEWSALHRAKNRTNCSTGPSSGDALPDHGPPPCNVRKNVSTQRGTPAESVVETPTTSAQAEQVAQVGEEGTVIVRQDNAPLEAACESQSGHSSLRPCYPYSERSFHHSPTREDFSYSQRNTAEPVMEGLSLAPSVESVYPYSEGGTSWVGQ
jgi:hypothetical protein